MHRKFGAWLVSVALLAALVAGVGPTPAIAAADDVPAPYRMIVMLEITYGTGGHAVCTGFMMGPHTVGTAGHCVRSATEGRAVEVRVIPGLSGLKASYGTAVASGYGATINWDSTQDDRFDFGTVTLPSDDLGNATGWFTIGTASDAALSTATFGTAGYRADRTYGTMWATSGPVVDYDPSFLYYHWDTTHGDSGSPIWLQTPTGYQVVGIVKGLITSNATGAVLVDFGIRVTPLVVDYFAARLSAPYTAQPVPAPRTFFTATAGAPVMLQGDSWPKSAPAELQSSPDRVRWSTVVTSATDAAGHVEFRLNATSTQYYRFVILGAAPGEPGLGVVSAAAPSTPGGGPPAAATGAGTFLSTPVFGAAGVAQVVFAGGTVDQLEVATRNAGAAGVWVQDASGVYQLLPVGAPAFVRMTFASTFLAGVPGPVAVTLTR